MARLLARIGRFASSRPWTVLVSWFLVLALSGGAFVAWGGALLTSLSIPNTPTQQVTDRLSEEFEGVGGAVGTIVFETEDATPFTEEQRRAISDALAEVEGFTDVARVVDPFVSDAERRERAADLEESAAQLSTAAADAEAGLAQLDAAQADLDAARASGAPGVDEQQAQLDAGRAEIEAGMAEIAAGQERIDLAAQLQLYADENRSISDDGTTAVGTVLFDRVYAEMQAADRLAVSEALEAADLDGVELNFSAELAGSLGGILGVGELVGIGIAALALVIVFGALLPAVLPLISSLIGVAVGVLGSLAFSDVVEMASITPILGVMLGLAVGIDYALFIIHRHRRQLREGGRLDEEAIRASIGLANGTAGNAVVFAGSTVFIALLALNVVGIPFLGVMGTVGAACVLVAVLVAITVTPALLGLAGPRVLGRRARGRIQSSGSQPQAAPRPLPTWRAVTSAVITVGVLLVLAIPALSMRLGLPIGSSEEPETTQYQAFTTIAEEFGEGRNGALVVTAEPESPIDVSDELAVLRLQAEIEGLLMDQESVVSVVPVGVAEDGALLAFQVVPEEGPSAESTEELVHSLRLLSPVTAVDDGDVALGVAGQASGNIDVSNALAAALPLYLAVVIGMSLVVMIVVFRSLLVPLIATGGFLLSYVAALGAVTAVYQWGWFGEVFGVHDPGPVLNFAPAILVGVLFGLAMDYQLFLGSGIREAYVHGVPARQAVAVGVRNARAVVIAAAIIMVAVFGGFIFSHLAMIRPIGFGLAAGVLLDAFLVRLVLMPALLHLLGRSAWWLPRWLDRILPDVDVEGASLERGTAGIAPTVAREEDRSLV